jgi:hypothetical protein
MATGLPASQRTREELTSLIEGRLSTGSAKDELVKLATWLIVEEALEGEAADVVGRDYHQSGGPYHGAVQNLANCRGLWQPRPPPLLGKSSKPA